MRLPALVLLLASPLAAADPACKFPDQPTLAILDVKTTGLPAEMAALLSDALRGNLVETRCFRVQDQAQMREILATQMINQSELCDESCVVQSGRLLQVRFLVTAQVYASGAGAVTVARLTDVETGTAVESAQVRSEGVTLPELLEAVRVSAGKLAGIAAAPAAAVQVAAPAGPPPPPEGPSVWPWVTLGLGAAAGIAGAVLGLQSRSILGEDQPTVVDGVTRHTITEVEMDRARSYGLGANVLFGLAGVLGLTGGLGLLVTASF